MVLEVLDLVEMLLDRILLLEEEEDEKEDHLAVVVVVVVVCQVCPFVIQVHQGVIWVQDRKDQVEMLLEGLEVE